MKKISGYFTIINLYRLTGIVLLVMGGGFYIFFGVKYGGWSDSGLTAFAAPIIAFGLLTIWLGNEKAKETHLAKK